MAFDPLTYATSGGVLGGLYGLANAKAEQDNLNKERQYQAAVARFSPWTKQTATSVGNVNPLQEAFTGATQGIAQGQKVSDYMAAHPSSPDSLSATDATPGGMAGPDSGAAGAAGGAGGLSEFGAMALTDPNDPANQPAWMRMKTGGGNATA